MSSMSSKHDTKFWILVIKLVLGALALIAFFGVGLYFTAKFNTYDPGGAPPDGSWGISKDSPVRSLR
jgi:hypothetical protein